MKIIKGITWNHTRGFVAVVAAAQRYEELHPEITIIWEKRSLQAFADASLEKLASEYDLIIMDHPHTPLAATTGALLPLDEYISQSFLNHSAENSVGQSHKSYSYDNHQWTLASDAAAPIATWRPDLIEKHKLHLPTSWEEVLDLASNGFVTVPFSPVDSLMHFYSFCEAYGGQLFLSKEELGSCEIMVKAMEELRKLAKICSPDCLSKNPIKTAEHMSYSNEISATYCPFAYGYSNYSRTAYSANILKAGELVEVEGKRLRSVLGGAGIAVSAKTSHKEICADFAQFTASPEIQNGVYFDSGGQPGHRSAWLNDRINDASANFFKDTLATLDETIVRPQYPGYMHFQDLASPIVHDCISGNITMDETFQTLNKIYRHSLTL